MSLQLLSNQGQVGPVMSTVVKTRLPAILLKISTKVSSEMSRKLSLFWLVVSGRRGTKKKRKYHTNEKQILRTFEGLESMNLIISGMQPDCKFSNCSIISSAQITDEKKQLQEEWKQIRDGRFARTP